MVIAWFLFYTWPSSANIPLVKLDYQDKTLQELRKTIASNLKKGEKIENIEWLKYTVKKEDNFFKIMAKTMQNHDTLSSVNQLASIFDIEKGITWLIPSARGIALPLDEIRVKYAELYKQGRYHKIPGNNYLYFLPGKVFSSIERKFFNLEIFIRPLSGIITSAFGRRNDPFTKKSRFHKGIDIACQIGSQVVAAAEGRVIRASWISGYGNTVILEHRNGYQSLYAHLSKFSVKEGQSVKQGQQIALSGNTGRSTGPHLHFEVLRRGKQIRPHF